MKLKKLIMSFMSVITAVSLILCSVPYGTVSHAQNVSDLEDEYEELEDQLKDAKQELEKLKEQTENYIEQRKNYENQMGLVSEQIDVIEAEIENLEESIELLQASIETLGLSVEELSAEIDENYELFKERLKAFHLMDNASTLEMLLNAESFKDFLSKYEIVKAIATHDEELMDKLEADKELIAEQKSDLESQMVELEAQKAELEKQMDTLDGKKDDLEELSDEAEAALKKAQSEEKEQQNLIDYIDKSLERLEEEIEEATRASQSTEYVGGDFIWPCPSYSRISSPFGYRYHPVTGKYKLHKGVDLAAPKGSNVLAANSGTVTAAYDYENGSYGKYLIINHGGGKVTLYAHCDDVLVRAGDTVEQGEVIAKVGDTGTATGYHLHFEIRIDGSYVNPMDYYNQA